MQFFSKFTSLLLTVGVASAATVTFKSLDNVDRTVYFTPNEGLAQIESREVKGGATEKVDFPDSWVGNFYSISEGKDNVPGMLGEVTFGGWNGITYFDVSAIIDANDHDGVHEMWPAESETPTSGCTGFPCGNAYYLSDDVQTRSTTETDLICTLGLGQSQRRSQEEVDAPAFKRDFVLGRWSR